MGSLPCLVIRLVGDDEVIINVLPGLKDKGNGRELAAGIRHAVGKWRLTALLRPQRMCV